MYAANGLSSPRRTFTANSFPSLGVAGLGQASQPLATYGSLGSLGALAGTGYTGTLGGFGVSNLDAQLVGNGFGNGITATATTLGNPAAFTSGVGLNTQRLSLGAGFPAFNTLNGGNDFVGSFGTGFTNGFNGSVAGGLNTAGLTSPLRVGGNPITLNTGVTGAGLSSLGSLNTLGNLGSGVGTFGNYTTGVNSLGNYSNGVNTLGSYTNGVNTLGSYTGGVNTLGGFTTGVNTLGSYTSGLNTLGNYTGVNTLNTLGGLTTGVNTVGNFNNLGSYTTGANNFGLVGTGASNFGTLASPVRSYGGNPITLNGGLTTGFGNFNNGSLVSGGGLVSPLTRLNSVNPISLGNAGLIGTGGLVGNGVGNGAVNTLNQLTSAQATGATFGTSPFANFGSLNPISATGFNGYLGNAQASRAFGAASPLRTQFF